jgi:EAL domain-containing protein (putative c-di-GMP-specific phosphodiesterase class I)
MREQALARSSLENDLHGVLENKELVLYYQPIINLHSLDIVGFEALIRWHHPRLGLILPEQFIPIAEEIGQIISISEWVLHNACLQLKRWHAFGKVIKMAVNLSARQFLQHDLYSTVKSVLEFHDLPARYLELEITETMIMRNVHETIRTLKKLQQLGVSISLDDFGTGYSSLTYLKQFPINALKIDRSFVKDVLSVPDDQVIVNSIIAIAQHMDLSIITEGIEYADQVIYLKEQGCQFGQGHFFCCTAYGG